jgi:hypothetical protein
MQQPAAKRARLDYHLDCQNYQWLNNWYLEQLLDDIVDNLIDDITSLNESFSDSIIQDIYNERLNSTSNTTFSELPSLNADSSTDSIDESGFINDYAAWWIQW